MRLMFQFHKVQLKGPGVASTFLQSSFQFHKVQLKGRTAGQGDCIQRWFQFHKVQLKVVLL